MARTLHHGGTGRVRVRAGNPFFADDFRVGRAMIYGNFDLKEFQDNLGWITADGMK